MEQQSLLITGAILLLAVLSSQAVTDTVKVVFHHPHPTNIHRTVTEGQRVILDCSHLLQSYRHVIQGNDRFRWRKGSAVIGQSAQLILKADQSTQGAYQCLALAAVAGEQASMMRTKTVHLTVEIPSCSVEGQVYMSCGTDCVPTCANPNPTNCTSSCVQGCHCPDGSVLDETSNKCVTVDQCECPPTCSHDYCSRPDNSRSPCNLPTDDSQCNIIQCNACYYSEEVQTMPTKCVKKVCKKGSCEKDRCLTSWANCINNKLNGRRSQCKQDCQTSETFHCFQYPTC
ncbi:SCO-spondin-like [Dysidea avara]|uniref:SCO-spondin-like n=1 Tax=Dysidea avara TaxID=196820 RepID=UPI003316657C